MDYDSTGGLVAPIASQLPLSVRLPMSQFGSHIFEDNGILTAARKPMSFKASHFGIFIITLSRIAFADSAASCLEVFTLFQNNAVYAPQPRAGKQVARLFVPKIISTPTPSHLSLSEPLSEHLTNPQIVMNEALKARKSLASVPRVQWANEVHIAFFEKQMPHVLRILEDIPTAKNSQAYHSVDANGELNKHFRTIGEAREYFRMRGQEALKQKHIGMAFFTEFVIDILGMHYALWKEFNFSDTGSYSRYRGYLKSQSLAQRKVVNGLGDKYFEPPNAPPLTPMIEFLRKIAEVKSKIESHIAEGNVFWPTFAKLKTENFEDWHLGIKPVAITLDREIAFDGTISDFFGIAIHDVTNHTLPSEMHDYSEAFSDFKSEMFIKFGAEDPIRAELMRKIWFKLTHETTGDIYSEYRAIKKARRDSKQSSAKLKKNNAAFIVSNNSAKDSFSPLTIEIKSPLYFRDEISPALDSLNMVELEQNIRAAWTRFLEIYQDAIDSHFNSHP